MKKFIGKSGFLLGSFFTIVTLGQDQRIYITQHDGRLDKESIPMQTAIWGRFLLVSAMEDEDAGLAHELLTKGIGLTSDGSNTFIDHARESVYKRQRLAAEHRSETCEKRDQLTTKSALVAELEGNERKSDLFEETRIADLISVLGDSDLEKISRWADDGRARMVMASGDLALMFQVEDVDPLEVLDRYCSRPNSNRRRD